ncbi:putative leucine-rich repeat-containing protein DDB_G0290503 [Macrobrachium rosenbergii]|uniref:putative leucine-rich repeat-containing protein DDB_G0290503 n=1 Tax=Macrobrachium rosenbergii TaxID=79674 RepID=UPI0034D6AB42
MICAGWETRLEGDVIRSIAGGWRTSSCPIATVAAGLVVTSLAFVAWRKLKHHEKTQKELQEKLEKVTNDKAGLEKEITSRAAKEGELRKENVDLQEQLFDALRTVQDMESVLREKDDENVNLINQMEDKDCMIQNLLAENEEMKQEQEHLDEELSDAVSTIEDMESLLEEKDDEKVDLNNQMEDKDHHIQDLLATKEKMNQERELLEEKLREAANTIEDLERRLKEQEAVNEDLKYVGGKVMDAYDGQIQDLLANEERLEKNNELLKEKLAEARNELEFTEKLSEEKEDEINGLIYYYDSQMEDADLLMQDLLANAGKMKEENELLRGSLAEALCNIEEFAKECEVLKESKEKAENDAKELQRLQEEALRMQDKYMLMGVLHRIAQRDFELERIAREEHEEEDTETETGETQDTASQDHGQETNQEFCCAQNDNRG